MNIFKETYNEKQIIQNQPKFNEIELTINDNYLQNLQK